MKQNDVSLDNWKAIEKEFYKIFCEEEGNLKLNSNDTEGEILVFFKHKINQLLDEKEKDIKKLKEVIAKIKGITSVTELPNYNENNSYTCDDEIKD